MATRTAGATTVEYYENTGASIAVAVNDALSLSYSMEDGEANYQTSATQAYDIEMKSDEIRVRSDINRMNNYKVVF